MTSHLRIRTQSPQQCAYGCVVLFHYNVVWVALCFGRRIVLKDDAPVTDWASRTTFKTRQVESNLFGFYWNCIPFAAVRCCSISYGGQQLKRDCVYASQEHWRCLPASQGVMNLAIIFTCLHMCLLKCCLSCMMLGPFLHNSMYRCVLPPFVKLRPQSERSVAGLLLHGILMPLTQDPVVAVAAASK